MENKHKNLIFPARFSFCCAFAPHIHDPKSYSENIKPFINIYNPLDAKKRTVKATLTLARHSGPGRDERERKQKLEVNKRTATNDSEKRKFKILASDS